MKRIIIILIVVIGLSAPLWIFVKTLIAPNQIKLDIPIDLPTDLYQRKINNVYVTVKIDSLANYYVNDRIARLDQVSTIIDSLAASGLNDSVIVLDAHRHVTIDRVIPIMNLTKETGRKMILKTR